MSTYDVAESVQRLATVVSLAARIEPELLRAARLRLLPDVDVSAEADLWFSELVESRSTKRMVLRDDVSVALRAKLAADPPLLHAARGVIADTHRNAPPAIQLEEEITYLGLTGGDVAEAINTKLTAVLNAIANEGRTGLVDWAARALPRMPDVVRNTAAAAALRLVTGGEAGDAMYVRRDVIDDPALAALVEKALPKTTVYARLVTGQDTFAVEISRTEMPGSHAIELPKTEPLILELRSAEWTEIVEVPREGFLMRTIVRSVTIRTIARDVFELEEGEWQRDSVRILVARPDAFQRPADLILIVEDVTRPFPEAFGNAPIVAVPGPGGDCAKTFVIANWRIGVVALNTSSGFHPSQLAVVCNGDAIAWRNAHHAAVLLMMDSPDRLDGESRHRWIVYGGEAVFDLVVCANAGDDAANVFGLSESDYREIELRPKREPVILAPEKTPSRSVLVAGIAKKLSPRTQEMSRVLGALIALQGHALVTGGAEGVDYLVAEGFDTAAPERVESILHYAGPRALSGSPKGRKIAVVSEEESVARSVHRADVVILIDGAGGTLNVGREALAAGKPLIAIGADAAASLRPESLRLWPPEAHERLLRLGNLSIAETVSVVRELLGAVPQSVAGTGGAVEGQKSVLLSYSSEEEDLLDTFRKEVTPLLEGTNIVLTYVNRDIEPAPVMISFISPRYVATRLRSKELPPPPGTRWFLCVAREAEYSETPAAAAEPAHDVSVSLDRIAPRHRNAIFRRMAADLIHALASSETNNARVLALYQAVLVDLPEDSLPVEWAMTQIRYGDALAGTVERLHDAIACYEAAQRVFTEREFPSRWATLQYRIGDLWSSLPDVDKLEHFRKAIEHYRAALRVFTAQGSHLQSAFVQSSLGNVYLGTEQIEEAIVFFRESLALLEQLGAKEPAAHTRVGLGRAFQQRGDVNNAVAEYTIAANIFESLGLAEQAREVRVSLSHLQSRME